MIVTSALIPPLAMVWRPHGALTVQMAASPEPSAGD
jgi:hypothetical protein